MFREVVSSLSFSPAADRRLVVFWRSLRREYQLRQLGLVMVLALAAIQAAIIIAPPDASNTTSSNDIISGGIGSRSASSNLLTVYDQDRDGYNHSGFRQLFNYFGINRADLAAAVPGAVTLGDQNVWLVGRNPHSSWDRPFRVGSASYFLRPLSEWGQTGSRPALIGYRHSDGAWFAVLDGGGNIAITQTPPAVASSTSPVSRSQSAVISSAQGSSRNADGAVANPGDLITYTLVANNPTTTPVTGYSLSDNLNDLLEYGTLEDGSGARLADGMLSWPEVTIAAHSSVIRQFQLQVKSPLPITPPPASDPQSFDYQLDNVFGNVVQVKAAIPPIAQLARAGQKLPPLGIPISSGLVAVLAAAVIYMTLRNRQLLGETTVLRGDHGGPGRGL